MKRSVPTARYGQNFRFRSLRASANLQHRPQLRSTGHVPAVYRWLQLGSSTGKFRPQQHAQNKTNKAYEHNQNQRWNADLLQGLGPGTRRNVLARLATELGRLEWSNALPRATRFP